LNPYGSYPASTSSDQTGSSGRSGDRKYANGGRPRCTEAHPEAPESTHSGGTPQSLELKPDRILASEAREILRAIRDGKPVSEERARRFARAWIEMQPLGALALGALDGGLFAGARLGELAENLVNGRSVDGTRARTKT
jgi:hypothetical protein